MQQVSRRANSLAHLDSKSRQLSFCPSPNKASVASQKCWCSSSSVLSLVPFLPIGLPVFVGP